MGYNLPQIMSNSNTSMMLDDRMKSAHFLHNRQPNFIHVWQNGGYLVGRNSRIVVFRICIPNYFVSLNRLKKKNTENFSSRLGILFQ